MLELRSPLARVLDGPALLIQRITAVLPRLDVSTLDPHDIMLSMGESDPDYFTYLHSEGLLGIGRGDAAGDGDWRS